MAHLQYSPILNIYFCWVHLMHSFVNIDCQVSWSLELCLFGSTCQSLQSVKMIPTIFKSSYFQEFTKWRNTSLWNGLVFLFRISCLMRLFVHQMLLINMILSVKVHCRYELVSYVSSTLFRPLSLRCYQYLIFHSRTTAVFLMLFTVLHDRYCIYPCLTLWVVLLNNTLISMLLITN